MLGLGLWSDILNYHGHQTLEDHINGLLKAQQLSSYHNPKI